MACWIAMACWMGCSFPDPNGDPLAECTNCELPNRKLDAGDPTADPRPSINPSTPDAGEPVTPKCSMATPFGAPKLVPGIDPARHASTPRVTPDEKTIFFTSIDPDVGAEVYRATRASKDAAFANVMAVPNINTASNENDPSVSSDGLTLVFHSGRAGTNDVWISKRADANAEWGTPAPAPNIGTAQYDGQGFFHNATNELVFVSNRGGTYDIFRAKLEGAAFGSATPVNELNTGQDDFLPWLTKDGLVLFFSSTRTGTKGGQDLFIATRTDPNGQFGVPLPVNELNTDQTEQAGSLSPDLCRIYFSRAGGAGGQQIFVAERPL